MPSAKIVSFLVVMPFLLGFDVWTKDLARSIPKGEEISVIHGWVSLVHASAGGVDPHAVDAQK
jgi:hypothetical protein